MGAAILPRSTARMDTTTTTGPSGPWTHLLWAGLGPAALGLALAAQDATRATEIGRLPVLWLGVAALMTPALYIGSALSGLDHRARDVVSAAARALGRGGALLAGLAPALLFVVVTSGAAGRALVGLAAIAGAVTGLGVLFRELFVEPDAGVLPRFVFLGWAAVLIGIAGQLYAMGA